MTMAILWRKKLVLHSSLVGVFIGISENPIIPPQFRPTAGYPQHRTEENTSLAQRLAGRGSRRGAGAGTIPLRCGAAGGRGWWGGTGKKKERKKILSLPPCF